LEKAPHGVGGELLGNYYATAKRKW